MAKRSESGLLPLGKILGLPFPDSSYQVLGNLIAEYRDSDEKRAQLFQEIMDRARANSDTYESAREHLRQLLSEIADIVMAEDAQPQLINFAHGLHATSLLTKLVKRVGQVNFCFKRWSPETGGFNAIYICCSGGTWKEQLSRPIGEVVIPSNKSIWLPKKRQKV